MANLVLSASGAAVGYFVSGATGAMIGWTLASAMTTKPAIGQPTIGDLRTQTSQYGINIPIVVGGPQRITGNIIWSTEKQPYETKSIMGGGKGGGQEVITVGYKISMAILLCKGEIAGISRMWQDGQLIVDAGNPLPGTVYLGNNTQNPDPTMESYLGAGEVPAYRGLAYIVLTDFDLGQAGRVPIFSFEVVKSGGI